MNSDCVYLRAYRAREGRQARQPAGGLLAHVRVGAPMYSTSRDIASARLRALSTSGAGGISQSGGKQATVLLGKY